MGILRFRDLSQDIHVEIGEFLDGIDAFHKGLVVYHGLNIGILQGKWRSELT